MTVEVARYFLFFFMMAVLGWCMEVTCKLIQFHRFINRGFLIGPYCPIYGVGAVLATLVLSRYSADPFAVFGLGILLFGTLEYATSYILEKLFHARWWDYSSKKYNINGRVCANTLIPFGLLGCFMVYLAKPWCFGLLAHFNDQVTWGLAIGIGAVMLTDSVVSSFVLGHIRHSATNQKGDSTEAITRGVHDELAATSALIRRQLRAFPAAKLYNAKLLDQVKKDREEMREKMRRDRDALRAEIARREASVAEKLGRK